MQLPITSLFAGLLALFALYLSAQAGTYRGKAGVSILYGEPANMELAQRVRRHQNFLEYVPVILLLMALIEINGGSTVFLYIVGALLIAARIAHARGLLHDNMAHPGRALGAGGTALIMLATAGYAVWMAVGALFM